VVSIVGGLSTLTLVWRGRFELARYSAALAVAAVVVGWALAQKPILLPGLTVEQAAAPHDTLVTLLVALAGGAVILLPSLALLFRLFLGGWFDRPPSAPAPDPSPTALLSASAHGLLGRVASACGIAGIGFLGIADAAWAHAVGVAALLAFVALGFLAIVLPELGGDRGAKTSGAKT
jgi:cytochrome d ubiquinol oxidase subunit II